MIRHHPGDELLLAQAAGRHTAGTSLLLDAHLEGCPTCRARLQLLEAVGGTLLADTEPELLAPEAWTRTLERLGDAPAPARPAAAQPPLDWPAGVPWPRSLHGSAVSRWRWMGPGMHWSRVTLPQDPAAALFLLRIAPGRSLPRHSHTGLELTQVLCGSFDDGRAHFAAGDFDAADSAILHQPVVSPGSVCICLAAVDGRLRFESPIAALIGGWIGM